jgi:hypothetical protein
LDSCDAAQTQDLQVRHMCGFFASIAAKSASFGKGNLDTCRNRCSASWQVGGLMRQRLRKFLPVFLVALALQVLAPISAAFAIAVATSDPAWSAEICHHDSDSPSSQGGDGNSGCEGGCPLCYAAAQADAWLNVPQLTAVAVPQGICTSVDWSKQAPGGIASRPGSNRQARAPPKMA